MLLHFCAHFLEMLFAEDILFVEQVFYFFSSGKLRFCEFVLSSFVITTSTTTFVASDGANTHIFLKTVFDSWLPVGFESILILLWLR
jgi:hypothetical protein